MNHLPPVISEASEITRDAVVSESEYRTYLAQIIASTFLSHHVEDTIVN